MGNLTVHHPVGRKLPSEQFMSSRIINITIIHAIWISKPACKLVQTVEHYIITPQKVKPISFSRFNTFIQCVINTIIRFTYPIINTLVIFPDKINTSIGGTAIYDYQFDIIIILIDDAAYGVFKHCRAVKDRHDDAKQRFSRGTGLLKPQKTQAPPYSSSIPGDSVERLCSKEPACCRIFGIFAEKSHITLPSWTRDAAPTSSACNNVVNTCSTSCTDSCSRHSMALRSEIRQLS